MKHILIHEENQICRVTLNRPEKHNAFQPEMIQELTEIFLVLERRQDLRAVILSGNGKSFSAGGDLEWMQSMVGYSHEENLHDARRLFDMYGAMANCHLPLIGLVHGNVMGGGLGLLAVCDVVAAEANTQFCFSEAKIGIAPAVISPWVLRKVHPGFAREVMLSAKIFNSATALRLGLIQFSGSTAEVEEYLKQTLIEFKLCAPGAVRAAKKLMNDICELSWSQLRDRATAVIADRRVSEEGQEGLKSFLEKKKPSWQRSP